MKTIALEVPDDLVGLAAIPMRHLPAICVWRRRSNGTRKGLSRRGGPLRSPVWTGRAFCWPSAERRSMLSRSPRRS